MGEHLPCKQGVKSSNLSISIRTKAMRRAKIEKRFCVMLACKQKIVLIFIGRMPEVSDLTATELVPRKELPKAGVITGVKS